MSSADSHNKLREQIASLRSSNQGAILDTIRELRSSGDVSVLPELFNLMLIQEDERILGEITALLNDLKDKESAEILAEAIANPEYADIQTVLLAACWQNGLSYGKHINTFVDVVVKGPYSAALEAFTVIEEAVGELTREKREALVRSMKSALRQVDAQKKPLFVELIKIIEAY